MMRHEQRFLAQYAGRPDEAEGNAVCVTPVSDRGFCGLAVELTAGTRKHSFAVCEEIGGMIADTLYGLGNGGNVGSQVTADHDFLFTPLGLHGRDDHFGVQQLVDFGLAAPHGFLVTVEYPVSVAYVFDRALRVAAGVDWSEYDLP